MKFPFKIATLIAGDSLVHKYENSINPRNKFNALILLRTKFP